jgi:hypothetical protein
MFRRVRRHWRDGGRDLVMRWWTIPGERPLGYWLCDVKPWDARRAEHECGSWAEVILFLGLANKAERSALKVQGIIAEQRNFLAEDRKLHPADHL